MVYDSQSNESHFVNKGSETLYNKEGQGPKEAVEVKIKLNLCFSSPGKVIWDLWWSK
jgi:hypothetical protein